MAYEQRVSQMEEEMHAAINGELEPVVELMQETDAERRVRFKCDKCCKAILRQRTIMALILKGLVSEFKDLSLDEVKACIIDGSDDVSVKPLLIGDSNETDTIDEKDIKFDFVIRARNPKSSEAGISVNIHVNTEAQRAYKNIEYPIEMRAQYYVARLLSRQLNPNSESEYGKLEKCYSIWLCGDVEQDEYNTITYYSMKSTSVGHVRRIKESYGLMDVVIVRLGSDTPMEDYLSEETKQVMTVFHRVMNYKDASKLKDALDDILEYDEYFRVESEVDDMGDSLRDLVLEAKGEARAEERDNFIKTLIESWAGMGKGEDAIYEELKQVAKLPEDEAMHYLNKYYKA